MDPKLRTAPTALYRLYDADGQLLYIGVTARPKARWNSHRRERPWWAQVARKELTWFDTRAEADAAEREAIQAEAPIHNAWFHPIKGAVMLAHLAEESRRYSRETVAWRRSLPDQRIHEAS